MSDITLKKYHYRFLGALERDLDSFNKIAGFPVEIVEALNRLHQLAKFNGQLFLRSPLLKDLIEFLLKIPEGLLPQYYASRIVTGRTDQNIRNHLKSLPLENYCALRCISFFFKTICFQSSTKDALSLIPFEAIDNSTNIIEALSPAPRDDRLKPLIIAIFSDPMRFFYSKSSS